MVTSLDILIEQYQKATGIKYVETCSGSFLKEFLEWVEQRQKIGENYIRLLNSMNVNYDDTKCAEIGKTEYDSVVMSYHTTIISPYIISNKPEHLGKLILGDFTIVDANPTLLKILNGRIVKRAIEAYQIKTFMTQNPTSDSEIKDWKYLHNCGDNNIIIGMYGNTYDKDLEDKLKRIKNFAETLTKADYKEDFDSVGDTYFYALASERAIKFKQKVKIR